MTISSPKMVVSKSTFLVNSILTITEAAVLVFNMPYAAPGDITSSSRVVCFSPKLGTAFSTDDSAA